MLEAFLLRRLAPVTRIGFLGLAKNTGKTTAFNFVARLLHEHAEQTGLVTSGRDGEATDLLFGNPKPPVAALRGQKLVTTEDEAARATAGLRPISSLSSTALGRLRVYDVTRPGEVVLVGPVTCDDLAAAVARLRDAGCGRVLVDGAVNRKAFARPGLVDGVIVCTGAALDPDPDRLVEKTADALAPFRLPLAAANGGKTVAGLFGDEAAAELMAAGFCGTVTVGDPSKVFLETYTRRRLAAAGVEIAVREAVPLLALSVNPTAPDGARLDGAALLDRLYDAFPGLPTMDVIACRLRSNPNSTTS